jgi:hypothetical protein
VEDDYASAVIARDLVFDKHDEERCRWQTDALTSSGCPVNMRSHNRHRYLVTLMCVSNCTKSTKTGCSRGIRRDGQDIAGSIFP